MKKILFAFCLSFLCSFLSAQCLLDFGSNVATFDFGELYGSDLVNGDASGANASYSESFNIWDEANLDCSTAAGANDITFDFEILHVVDRYGIDGVIDQYAGITHEITQSGSGLRGNIPLGNSSTNETSAGDARGYKITVTFTSGMLFPAADVTVNTTSVNTSGEAWESTAIVFLDGNLNPYGSATHDGFYGAGSIGASTDGSCAVPAPSLTPWTVIGPGVYTMPSTSTIDQTTDGCNPVGISSGPDNNKDVNAQTDAGLAATDLIGGFTFTVFLEDVAASSAPGAETSTATQFSSTLNGVDLPPIALPVELINFDAKPNGSEVVLIWSTATELNNDYFMVETSDNGRDYYFLNKVEGAGNTVDIQSYEYVHRNVAKGLHYYRLKQVDMDGSFEYSEVAVAKIDHADKPYLEPTIARDYINLILPKEYDKTDYKLFNLNGQVLKTGILNDETELDVSYLSEGIYFLGIIYGQEEEVLRFIKAR